MYSLLMMTAMAGSPDVSSFGWNSGCYGSSCYGSCYGSTYTCYGCTGCNGCYGSRFPVARFLWRTVTFPVRVVAAPFRPHYAYYYDPVSYGYGSCYGSCYGSGCYGSCYGSGCFGTPSYGSAAESVAPTAYYTPTVQESFVVTGKEIGKVPARLEITLPAKAKLYVDGNLVAGEGELRRFHTPELTEGKSFYYDLKAEIQIDGRTEVEEKRVVVRSGGVIVDSFSKLIAMTKTVKEIVTVVK